ncbi:hypothetical protein PI125_g5354 [Phytophthora idaei]|nr:hypothetical protein PI125_g5354 [Phytophthora idaei]
MSSNGFGGQMYSSHPEESTRTPMTAIASCGGCTLKDVPGTPGVGFGNPVFQPMDWAEIVRQQRALTLGGIPARMKYEPKTRIVCRRV